MQYLCRDYKSNKLNYVIIKMPEYEILSIVAAFLMSAVCGGFFIPALLNFCKQKNLYDIPNMRKIHKCLVPRLGGISFMPSMFIAFAFACILMRSGSIEGKIQISAWSIGFLISLLLIYIVGIVDDLVGLGAKVKFAAQFLSAGISAFSGLYLNDLYGLFGVHEVPFYVGLPLTVLLIVFVDNAINLIDGIDGLSASLSIIALLGFLGIMVYNHMLVYSVLIAGLIGVLIVYLYFNVWGNPEKNRKIFMGDAGSLTLGFILGFLFVKSLKCDTQIMSYSPLRVALAYSMLVVPTFDVLRVILYRLRHHKPLFDADKSHIHHKLMALGFSQHKTLVCILVLQLCFVVVNLLLLQVFSASLTFILLLDIALYTMFHLCVNFCRQRLSCK